MNLAEVTQTYGESYQADSAAAEREQAWTETAAVLVGLWPEKRDWLDIGCGAGPLLQAIMRFEREAYGIEGSLAAIGKVPRLEGRILLWDLRVPCRMTRKFDAVTCFDTGEHVGNADALVETISAAAHDLVIFGAAPPGQDGLGHIDCRPPEDWHDRFEDRGFLFDPATTAGLRQAWKDQPHTNMIWWVEKNACVYRREIG